MDVTQTAPERGTEHGRDSHAGRRRVVVERLQPEIDAGRFAIKRTIGETVTITVDMFADGHDLLAGVLKYRKAPTPPARSPIEFAASVAGLKAAPAREDTTTDANGPALASTSGTTSAATAWTEVPLTALDNDAWTASFTVTELGTYEYTVEGWIDRFGSWLKGLVAKAEAGQDVASELLEGAELIERAGASGRLKAAPTVTESRREAENTHVEKTVGAAFRLPDADDDRLRRLAETLRGPLAQEARVLAARDPELSALMQARPDRTAATEYARTLSVIVDTVRARYGAWYEMFPRSCTSDPARGATLREAEARLPEIADLGFDVLYLPPIHPIGRSFRKGRNNSLTAEPGDPGSPWAIGAPEGGHTAIEPGLGTIDDFDRFVATATRVGLDVALDIAFQASPDHPWVREHPEWFKHRPDGSIKYAENPPKKYQDIYPIDFDSVEWPSLWEALKNVFLFWASHGVTIFRVDNPHTKAFLFWEWCIAEVKRVHPEAVFLAEAFTRPKLMRYLAKAGFTQSYTYFTWRNQAYELRDYLTELTRTELQEYMRPNFFANTPDILNEYLVHGGRPAFEVRLVLAATLAATYGIYSGFELCENVPVRPGSEEYLDSEKYQIKVRDYRQPGNLNELVARINQIRREHAALQQNATLTFHNVDNPLLLWYSKTAPAQSDRVFVVANTDPRWVQHGFIEVPLSDLGIAPDTPYLVEDLLDGTHYTWRGAWNYVRLDPAERMAHVFVIHHS